MLLAVAGGITFGVVSTLAIISAVPAVALALVGLGHARDDKAAAAIGMVGGVLRAASLVPEDHFSEMQVLVTEFISQLRELGGGAR